jgi:uncharacterized protein DUF4345
MTDDRLRRAMVPFLVSFAAGQIAIGVLQAAAPGTFFDNIGPFGVRNDHYLRDVSSFYLALGAVTLVAVRRPAWRVPVLAFAAIQYGLHSLNHLKDIGDAKHHDWLGPADFAGLAITTVFLALFLVVASREARR